MCSVQLILSGPFRNTSCLERQGFFFCFTYGVQVSLSFTVLRSSEHKTSVGFPHKLGPPAVIDLDPDNRICGEQGE